MPCCRHLSWSDKAWWPKMHQLCSSKTSFLTPHFMTSLWCDIHTHFFGYYNLFYPLILVEIKRQKMPLKSPDHLALWFWGLCCYTGPCFRDFRSQSLKDKLDKRPTAFQINVNYTWIISRTLSNQSKHTQLSAVMAVMVSGSCFKPHIPTVGFIFVEKKKT